jgi:hypothetical protein
MGSGEYWQIHAAAREDARPTIQRLDNLLNAAICLFITRDFNSP